MKITGKIRALAFASVSAAALSAPAAFAQTAQGGEQQPQTHGVERRGEGKGRGHHGGRFGKRDFGKGEFGGRGLGFRGVELSDEQKARVRQIHESHRASTKGLREQIRAKRQELREAQQGTTFNESLATQKLSESAAIEARLMAAQFRMRQELLAVLTPEQKTQIEQRREQLRQKREQFRGRRGERREGRVEL